MKKWLSLISIVLLTVGCERKPPVVIKETKDSIWVKRYSILGGDSTIYRYSQPKTYYGKVVRKRNSKHSRRNLWIELDNGEVIHRTHVSGYYDFQIGDKVKVIYTEYPYPSCEYKIEKIN